MSILHGKLHPGVSLGGLRNEDFLKPFHWHSSVGPALRQGSEFTFSFSVFWKPLGLNCGPLEYVGIGGLITTSADTVYTGHPASSWVLCQA